MLDFAYKTDVVQQTIQQMTEFDPEWTLPANFFPLQSEQSVKKDGVVNGK